MKTLVSETGVRVTVSDELAAKLSDTYKLVEKTTKPATAAGRSVSGKK